MKVQIIKIVTRLFTGAFLLIASVAGAQPAGHPAPDRPEGMDEFIRKVQDAYRQAAYLSFRVKYYYANADQPGTYLDSLSGEVDMDKGRSRVTLGGMETILTDKYAIQVMTEDKVIYLAAARQGTPSNPVGILDSLFTHIQGTKAGIQQEGSSSVMTLLLPPGQAYSSVAITIDSKTGYFRKVSYALNTAGLVGQEMIDGPGHPTPYQAKGQMEVVFSDYHTGGFDERTFQEQNFFTRTAGQFQAAGRYKDYHIFLASSNL